MAPTKEELAAVTRVPPAELAALIERSTREGSAPPLVVDVRDEDFELKGHVRGAVHLPQENFVADADVDALVETFAPAFRELVFHCGRSNTRGPSCALRFMARLDAAQLPDGVDKPRVRVLAGGFAAFAEVDAVFIFMGMLWCRLTGVLWVPGVPGAA
jgi:rhodanese-related sulfurtransferase